MGLRRWSSRDAIKSIIFHSIDNSSSSNWRNIFGAFFRFWINKLWTSHFIIIQHMMFDGRDDEFCPFWEFSPRTTVKRCNLLLSLNAVLQGKINETTNLHGTGIMFQEEGPEANLVGIWRRAKSFMARRGEMKIAYCRSAQHMFVRVTQRSDILIQYFSTLASRSLCTWMFVSNLLCWAFCEERMLRVARKTFPPSLVEAANTIWFGTSNNKYSNKWSREHCRVTWSPSVVETSNSQSQKRFQNRWAKLYCRNRWAVLKAFSTIERWSRLSIFIRFDAIKLELSIVLLWKRSHEAVVAVQTMMNMSCEEISPPRVRYIWRWIARNISPSISSFSWCVAYLLSCIIFSLLSLSSVPLCFAERYSTNCLSKLSWFTFTVIDIKWNCMQRLEKLQA